LSVISYVVVVVVVVVVDMLLWQAGKPHPSYEADANPMA